jgi:hypothetical protein
VQTVKKATSPAARCRFAARPVFHSLSVASRFRDSVTPLVRRIISYFHATRAGMAILQFCNAAPGGVPFKACSAP